MAYTTINKPQDYFNTVIWEGTGSSGTKGITGLGHQPDFLWIKNRDASQEYWLANSTRGTGKFLESNSNNQESSDGATGLYSFDSDGFTLGTGSNRTNQLNSSMVAWSWKINGGTTSSNSDGSITSTVQANTTSGISIVTWSGNDTAGDTVGHGLGKKPDVIFGKRLDGAVGDWSSYHNTSSLGATKYMRLNNGNTLADTDTYWNDTEPTSSVFTLSTTDNLNASGDNFIAFCFTSIKGFSKFGEYTGNGNTDGTFVYTGFKPGLVIAKNIDDASTAWYIRDIKRSTYNPADQKLNLSDSGTEGNDGNNIIDIVSNGFKMRSSLGHSNASGKRYLYLAFAEAPIVGTNNVPANAR